MFSRNAKAFTLLEVMLAVAVMALAGIAIYRFVENTMRTVQACRDQDAERDGVAAFVHYVRARLQQLPEGAEGALLGQPHRFGGIPSDELCWLARPGSGVLTGYASGDWKVTLTAKELEKGRYELGLRRRSVDGKRQGDWLPLLGGIRGFEVRYFDAARKEWMEKWTDETARPSLVRIKFWRDPLPEPRDIIFPIPPMVRPSAGQGTVAIFDFGEARVRS